MKSILAFGACISLLATAVYAQDRAFVAKAAAMYEILPNIDGCKAGTLAASEKKQALDVVNLIRAQHNLPPVVYDYSADQEVMGASLILAASGRLSHTPTQDLACWTPEGRSGAGSSNLSGGVISPYLGLETTKAIIFGWLTDERNAIPDNVGHRRWILDPFLERIAFGRVAGELSSGKTHAAALKVIYPSSSPTSATVNYVAYPSGDYPNDMFHQNALLSFSVVANTASKFANQRIDFSTSKITITSVGGRQNITDVRYDNIGFGLPNNLQFKVGTILTGVRYDVVIENVNVNGEIKNYQYWFRLTPAGQ